MRASTAVGLVLVAAAVACGGDGAGGGDADTPPEDVGSDTTPTDAEPVDAAPTDTADARPTDTADTTVPDATDVASDVNTSRDTADADTSEDPPTDVTPDTSPEHTDPLGFDFCDDAVDLDRTILTAGPDDYLARLASLGPGTTLRLTAGTYTGGLPLHDISGEAGRCVVIEGPADGAPAILIGSSSRNTVSIADASYLVVRHLELDGAGEWGDAVKAEGTDTFAHHIIIEHLFIHDHDVDQQVVGISTKCPTWFWVIRYNTITSTGTGMYLGNSDGSAPFVNGLIEHNLVFDTVGYNAQIKHQNQRPSLDGMPESGRTVIRYNVFSKSHGASTADAARPNLLIGHLPPSGAGVDDLYVVYGNFFFGNPTEGLMQAEGNLAIYSNIFVNDAGAALRVQPHNGVPRDVRIFGNTVVATERGLLVTGGDPTFAQVAVGNAVFADPGIGAEAVSASVDGTHSDASGALVAPFLAPGEGLDVHGRGDALRVTAWDPSMFDDLPDADLDFDRHPRRGEAAGAYAIDAPTGWTLDITPRN